MTNNRQVSICGCKLVELPYLEQHLIFNATTLIVGERIGNEGIVDAVLRHTTTVYTTDMDDLAPDSVMSDLVRNGKVVYTQSNFLDYTSPSPSPIQCIACINVLEHFGMCWGGTSDTMHWNWDLRGLEKMMELATHRIIVTVPAGPPIFYGDTLTDGLPFLRRYDSQRMGIIRALVHSKGWNMSNDSLFFSPTLGNDWQPIPVEALIAQNAQYQLTSPNHIWAFTLDKTIPSHA